MRLVVVIGSVTLVGLLVAVWAGAMLVRRSLRPLEHVAAVASSVTSLDLERGDTDIDVRVAPRTWSRTGRSAPSAPH